MNLLSIVVGIVQGILFMLAMYCMLVVMLAL